MGPMLWTCRCSGMVPRLSGKVLSALRVTVTVPRVTVSVLQRWFQSIGVGHSVYRGSMYSVEN